MATRKPAAKATKSSSKMRSRIAKPPTSSARERPKLRDVKADKPSSAADEAASSHLEPTDQEGVYRNEAGVLVDKYGVLLSLSILRKSEQILDEEIIGEPVDTPAKLLKRVALDPRMPMAWRLDAAKAAAPYFDRKTPVAVEQTTQDFALDMERIAKMPRDKRVALLETLRELGVNLAPPTPVRT